MLLYRFYHVFRGQYSEFFAISEASWQKRKDQAMWLSLGVHKEHPFVYFVHYFEPFSGYDEHDEIQDNRF